MKQPKFLPIDNFDAGIIVSALHFQAFEIRNSLAEIAKEHPKGKQAPLYVALESIMEHTKKVLLKFGETEESQQNIYKYKSN